MPKQSPCEEVSFDAWFGEMLFIEGPSGSGKTTLLSLISGILRPNSGTVLVEDRDIWNMTSDQIADFRLNKVGFVFQDYHLFPAPDHGRKCGDPPHSEKKSTGINP